MLKLTEKPLSMALNKMSLFFITVEDSVSYPRRAQYCIYRPSSTRMARSEDGREVGSDARNC